MSRRYRIGSAVVDYTTAPQPIRRRTTNSTRAARSDGRVQRRWTDSFNFDSDEDSYYYDAPPSGRTVYGGGNDSSSDDDVVHVSFKFTRRSQPPPWAQQPQYVYQTQHMPMPVQFPQPHPEVYEQSLEPSQAVQVFDAATPLPPQSVQPLVAQMPAQQLQPDLSVLDQAPPSSESPPAKAVTSSTEKPDTNYEVPPDTVPRYRQGDLHRRSSVASSHASSVRSKANSLHTGSHRQWRKLVYYIPVDKDGKSLPATAYHVRPEVLENLLKQGIMEEKELDTKKEIESPDLSKKDRKISKEKRKK